MMVITNAWLSTIVIIMVTTMPHQLVPLALIFCRLRRRNLMTSAPPARLQDCQTAKYFHQHHDHRHYDHHRGHDHHDQNHHHGHDHNDEYDQCYICNLMTSAPAYPNVSYIEQQ